MSSTTVETTDRPCKAEISLNNSIRREFESEKAVDGQVKIAAGHSGVSTCTTGHRYTQLLRLVTLEEKGQPDHLSLDTTTTTTKKNI